MASLTAEASKDLSPTTEDKDVLFSAAAAGLLMCPVHSWECRFLDCLQTCLEDGVLQMNMPLRKSGPTAGVALQWCWYPEL